jgi:hypothetical protein
MEGGQELCKCPLHEAKRNITSFSFTCRWLELFFLRQERSGAIDSALSIKGVGLQGAVKLLGSVEPLSRNTRLPAPSPKAPDLSPSASENPPIAGHYYKYFVPSDWLATRGLEARTLERFGVGEYNNPARASAYKAKSCFL